jgi:hypothetical protein
MAGELALVVFADPIRLGHYGQRLRGGWKSLKGSEHVPMGHGAPFCRVTAGEGMKTAGGNKGRAGKKQLQADVQLSLTCEHRKGGGLPCTIVAQQNSDLPFIQVQVQVSDCCLVLISHLEHLQARQKTTLVFPQPSGVSLCF